MRGDCLLWRVLCLRAQESSLPLPHSELSFSESSLVFQVSHMTQTIYTVVVQPNVGTTVARLSCSCVMQKASELHCTCCQASPVAIFGVAEAWQAAWRSTLHYAHTQILHMLRGCPSPGTAFHLSPAKDAFEVAASLHVLHLSPACLRNVLLRWTRIGTAGFR